jgi:hypothetical protein
MRILRVSTNQRSLRINFFGGTGLRPIDNTIGVRNVMLMQFQVQPAGVWNQSGVNFDITRQIGGFAYAQLNPTSNWQTDTSPTVMKWAPREVERSNDDSSPEIDENAAPTPNNGFLYVEDSPGFDTNQPQTHRAAFRYNFREWFRISFGTGLVEGEGEYGSRASAYQDWHVAHLLQNQNGSWIRTTGDNQEQVGVNSIGPGHIFVGPPQ